MALIAPHPGLLEKDTFAVRAEEAFKMMTSPRELAEVRFAVAAQKWLEYRQLITPSGRARFVSPRSITDLNQYIQALNRAFGNLTLNTIHVGHIREYQTLRVTGKLHPPGKPEREVGPNKVNQEIGTLVRILKHTGCWTAAMDEMYMPLQREESDIPRALSPSEQQRWLDVASSRPPWAFVYWYSLLALDCPMSTNEQRGLRIGDLDLHNNLVIVRVQNSKNKYRTRSIPLSDTARWAVDQMLARAKEAKATAPQQYLMPLRVRRRWLPDRPMTVSGIKRHWQEVRQASDITWFRPYDLRHTSLTRYAESGAPIAVMMSLAGHVTRKMVDHYTHISEQAKRKAVQNVRPNYVAQQRQA